MNNIAKIKINVSRIYYLFVSVCIAGTGAGAGGALCV